MSKSRRELGGEVIVISAWRHTRRQAVRGWGNGGRSKQGTRVRSRSRRTVEDEVFIVSNPNRCVPRVGEGTCEMKSTATNHNFISFCAPRGVDSLRPELHFTWSVKMQQWGGGGSLRLGQVDGLVLGPTGYGRWVG